MAMLFSRAVSVACSVRPGWLTVLVEMGDVRTSWRLGILVLLMIIPIYYGLSDKFPVWHHLTFLFTLVPNFVFSGRSLRHKRLSADSTR
jgi:hypothetical protein